MRAWLCRKVIGRRSSNKNHKRFKCNCKADPWYRFLVQFKGEPFPVTTVTVDTSTTLSYCERCGKNHLNSPMSNPYYGTGTVASA